MNVFDRIARYVFKNLSLTDPKAWDKSLWNLYGSQSLAGENVTETTALTYSAVYNAISLISGTIASLPLHLMQSKGTKKRLAEDYKLYGVMHDTWNPFMTSMAGRECMMAHILAWGNGYAEKVRDGYGDVIELWPIYPDRVRVEMINGQMIYEIQVPNGSSIVLPRENILHIAGPSPDGFLGWSVIRLAAKGIGLGMAMETFGSEYFGQGTHPGVIVSHPGVLKDPTQLQTALTNSYSGLGKAHRLMLLQEGMKIEKVTIPPNESQFLESRQFQIPEIARWFNLPPHKLKDLTRSSFSNIEQEQISFVQDSILPWLVRLEQNYFTQLLTKSDRELSGRGRLYFKHSVEGLLRGDSASRATYYREMFNIGAMSINEIRAKEELEPVKGGDIHLVPMNMTTLENAGKPPEPVVVKEAVEEEEPEKTEESPDETEKSEKVSPIKRRANK